MNEDPPRPEGLGAAVNWAGGTGAAWEETSPAEMRATASVEGMECIVDAGLKRMTWVGGLKGRTERETRWPWTNVKGMTYNADEVTICRHLPTQLLAEGVFRVE